MWWEYVQARGYLTGRKRLRWWRRFLYEEMGLGQIRYGAYGALRILKRGQLIGRVVGLLYTDSLIDGNKGVYYGVSC